MGGRGSAYYENKNAQIEKLMLQLPKRKMKPIKPDPESLRQDYEQFGSLKAHGFSTRQSTDPATLEQLKPHQEQLLMLLKKYKRQTAIIKEETEVEFSRSTDDGSHGYLMTGYNNTTNKLFLRLALSNRVIRNPKAYVLIKGSAIKQGHSAEVDTSNIHLFTTTHEFGHFLEESLIRKAYQEKNKSKSETINYSIFRDLYATKIKQDIEKIWKKEYTTKEESDKLYVSSYADDGGVYEWFAETFTNLELSSNPKPIAKALKKYLGDII